MLWLVFVLSLVSFGLLSATVTESYFSVPREDNQISDSMAEQDDWVDLHRPYVVNLEDEERREKEMRKRNMYLPEKALSAYDFFAKEERLKLKEKNPNYPEEELDKEIDKLWKEADFETKAKYGRLAGIDRARYLGEYETYVYTKYDLEFDDDGNLIEDCDLASDEDQPGTSEAKPNSPDMAGQDYSVDLHRQNRTDEPEDAPVCESKRRRRDPNLPKRPLSAFFWFTNEERSKVKASYPDYNVSEIAKELGKRWGEADPETKAKFERIAEHDRKRYEQELEMARKYLNVEEDDDFAPKDSDDDNDFHGDGGGASTSNR
nr:high mobility group protein B3 [Helicoverpa armigera]